MTTNNQSACSQSDSAKMGLYIHIPFCQKKCNYCGFYSGPAGEEERSAYVEKLIGDIRYYSKMYGKNCTKEVKEPNMGDWFLHNGFKMEEYLDRENNEGRRTVDTIFIGGGTPSILEGRQIAEILAAVRENFQVTEDAEITIESNPKTLTRDKLMTYRAAGINRISIGLQSFDAGCLEKLGRIHGPEDFLESYNMARECGFDNINVDLMFAIPGQTMEIWEDTLAKVIELEPEHISFYSLQIEEDTPFYESFMAGEFEEIPDDVDREMYHRAIALLKEAGYEHYEISNAAKPGHRCRHNLKYWSLEEYLGIGANASSYIGGVRFGQEPSDEYCVNTFDDDASEFVFTGLRKMDGISIDDFENRFNVDFWRHFKSETDNIWRFINSEDLIYENFVLRLSEKGIDISNRIMAVFV